jgi:hypothetical protein
MPSGLAAAVLLVTVVMASCGDDRSTTTSPTTPRPTASSRTVPGPGSNAGLLDASDVGPDWRIGPDVNDADLTDATRIPCPDVALNPTIAARLTPAAGVQFEPADHSYRHLIEFVVTGEPHQLDSDLRAFFGAIESCSTVTPAPPAELRVEQRRIPQFGDQRGAFVLVGRETPDTPATWYVRNAVVRVGPVAVELGLAEILSTPEQAPHISDAEFDELLGRAVSKARG